jgi:iron-sulfur cluster repair protein YtfE (RIC family)
MPRHPSLVPLSHDHHHGLVIALRLKKGGPASPHDIGWPKDLNAQAEALAKFAQEELLPHFALEEEIVFPALLGAENQELQAVITELLTDHKRMRELLTEVKNGGNGLSEAMKGFGELLERHIRTEERMLFPLAETEIGKGTLQLPIEEIEARHAAYLTPPACEA